MVLTVEPIQHSGLSHLSYVVRHEDAALLVDPVGDPTAYNIGKPDLLGLISTALPVDHRSGLGCFTDVPIIAQHDLSVGRVIREGALNLGPFEIHLVASGGHFPGSAIYAVSASGKTVVFGGYCLARTGLPPAYAIDGKSFSTNSAALHSALLALLENDDDAMYYPRMGDTLIVQESIGDIRQRFAGITELDEESFVALQIEDASDLPDNYVQRLMQNMGPWASGKTTLPELGEVLPNAVILDVGFNREARHELTWRNVILAETDHLEFFVGHCIPIDQPVILSLEAPPDSGLLTRLHVAGLSNIVGWSKPGAWNNAEPDVAIGVDLEELLLEQQHARNALFLEIESPASRHRERPAGMLRLTLNDLSDHAKQIHAAAEVYVCGDGLALTCATWMRAQGFEQVRWVDEKVDNIIQAQRALKKEAQ